MEKRLERISESFFKIILPLIICKLLTTELCRSEANSEGLISLSREGEWTEFEGFEYYVGSTSPEVVTWYEARQLCMWRSSDLASILNSGEYDFVNQLLGSSHTGYAGPLWIGLNHLVSTSWRWIEDGQALEGAGFWDDGYPVIEDADMPAFCAHLDTESEGRWRNVHCESIGGFVCKRPINVVTTPKTERPTDPVSGYCPANYFGVVNSNKCYRLVRLDEGVSWNEAVQRCRDEPGFFPGLASITSEEEKTAIEAELEDQRFGLHISLKRVNGRWLWLDNSQFLTTNWALYQPEGLIDNCTEIWILPGPPGTWNNIDCEIEKRGYVCQTYKDASSVINTPPVTTPHQCPPGYAPYWYACYKAYAEPKNWNAAKETCVQDGGHLASIHSEMENARMKLYLNEVLGVGFDLVWIGLEYLPNTEVYYWTDNWHVVFTKWSAGQPNRTSEGGCVGIDQVGAWKDAPCSEQLPFLCKTTTAPPMTTPAMQDGVCPRNVTTSYPSMGWFPYGGYCYGVTTSSWTQTWQSAQTACRTAAAATGSGNLVSIHNPQESVFVGDLVKNYMSSSFEAYWIGMSKSEAVASYEWIDGTEVEFTHWQPGEPNDFDGTHNCVRAYGQHFPNTWDDHSCSMYYPYVCKVKKAPFPTTPPMPSHVPGVCPNDLWMPYGTDCFLFRPDDYATRAEAEADCRAHGAFLAVVNNKDENWILHNGLIEETSFFFVRDYWIGLKRDTKENRFIWDDGSALDYSNWMTGHPIVNDASKSCVSMNGTGGQFYEMTPESALWLSADCSELKGYACRIEKQAPTSRPGDDGGGSGGGGKTGAIVGAVFGVIVLLALVAVAAYFGFRWYKGRDPVRPAAVSNSAPGSRGRNNNKTGGHDNVNYFEDLENQDLSSVRIGRLELKD